MLFWATKPQLSRIFALIFQLRSTVLLQTRPPQCSPPLPPFPQSAWEFGFWNDFHLLIFVANIFAKPNILQHINLPPLPSFSSLLALPPLSLYGVGFELKRNRERVCCDTICCMQHCSNTTQVAHISYQCCKRNWKFRSSLLTAVGNICESIRLTETIASTIVLAVRVNDEVVEYFGLDSINFKLF